MSYSLKEERAIRKVLVSDSVYQYLEKKSERESLLLRKDIRLIKVAGGMEVMNKINEELPALIAIDAEMPGMAGHTIAGILKKDKKTSAIPIILAAPLSERARLAPLCAESRADHFEVLDRASEALLDKVCKILGLEVRRAPRMAVDLKVDSPNFVAHASGSMKNISRTGMLVEVKHCNFERGYPLQLAFDIGSRRLEIRGEIVRMFYSDRLKAYEVGIEFRQVSPEDQEVLDAYLRAPMG